MAIKEDRINRVALAYYSRTDVQQAIFSFCKNRETVVRSFDSFGKRPDVLEYPSEVFQAVKKQATSFHCSEELWQDPLEIKKEFTQEQYNQLRIGWDLLLDIDCKYFDFSKKAAQAILAVLENHGIKNYGIKFSGSKGFHIIVPWKAFPKEINSQPTQGIFPEIPRIIASYIRFKAEQVLKESISEEDYTNFKKSDLKRGIKCKTCNEIVSTYLLADLECDRCKRKETKRFEKQSLVKNYNCPECRGELKVIDIKKISFCRKCEKDSTKEPDNFSQTIETDLFELMGLDIILVSPRHLFRAPYSLHEKTSLSSIVISKSTLSDFQPTDANPLKVEIKSFYPEAKADEAKNLLITALDWSKENKPNQTPKTKKEFKTITIDKRKIVYPPCIGLILKGMKDGKKRALFILLNYFRSLNFEFDEIEQIIIDWNKKNNPQLRQGYIKTQIAWAKTKKQVLPPNCDKDYYKGIGVCIPDQLCQSIKNPVNYTVRMQRRKKWKKK